MLVLLARLCARYRCCSLSTRIVDPIVVARRSSLIRVARCTRVDAALLLVLTAVQPMLTAVVRSPRKSQVVRCAEERCTRVFSESCYRSWLTLTSLVLGAGYSPPHLSIEYVIGLSRWRHHDKDAGPYSTCPCLAPHPVTLEKARSMARCPGPARHALRALRVRRPTVG